MSLSLIIAILISIILIMIPLIISNKSENIQKHWMIGKKYRNTEKNK